MPNNNSSNRFSSPTQLSRRRRTGVALVIVLALVTLLTVLVVVLLARTSINRSIENSSASRSKASLLAHSAGELVVADLKKEMAIASTVSGSAPNILLSPTNSAGMVPTRVLTGGSAMASDANFDNLIKQSGGTVIGTGNIGGLIDSSATSTSIASIDGHYISSSRWSAPQLIGSTAGLSTFTKDQVPFWCLMSRKGVLSNQTWDPSFADKTSSNANYVIGRFAYNVYDEGGLLDVNSAGYPASAATGTSLKGALGTADLSQIPGISVSNVDTFIKSWRNLATGQNMADYLAYLGLSNSSNQFYGVGPSKAFLAPASSATDEDNRLLDRQDLIRLVNNGTLGISTAALPYLSTFNRCLNAPSYIPPVGRPTVHSDEALKETPAPVYGQDDLFNPSVLSVTVQNTFTRADGTQAVVGEPLLKKRFPLSRLALVTDQATATQNQSDPIYKYFGLYRNSANSAWTYNHGNPDHILKLSEVAALPAAQAREPDFFELLQAGISVGSLAKGFVTKYTPPFNDISFHILQIGANLLDQYNTDGYPRQINFGSAFPATVIGIQNLPYLTRVYPTSYRPAFDPTRVYFYFQPEIWNPNQNASMLPANGPSLFRFVSTGRFYVTVNYATITSGTYNYLTTAPAFATMKIPPPTGGIRFTPTSVGAKFFIDPLILAPSNGATATGSDDVNDAGNHFVGLYGVMSAPCPQDGYYLYGSDPNYNPGHVPFLGGGGGVNAEPNLTPKPWLNFYLQYSRDGGATWITYNSLEGDRGAGDAGFNGVTGVYSVGGCYTANIDPRTQRFGPTSSYYSEYGGHTQETMRPDYTKAGWETSDYAIYSSGGTDYPGFFPTGPLPYGAHYGYLTENSSARDTYYADPDGVIRPGDAAYASGANGQPLQSGPPYTNRQIILNRPFRSVAEMGYAFRDLPSKTLDFFTSTSADSALLDLFCLNEQSGSPVAAGCLNLNTRRQPVLKAMLAGTLKDQMTLTASPSTIDPTTEADQIASLITATTSASPMANRSELATKICPALNYANFSLNPTDGAVKTHRESVVRALADVGDTRTWNLLIDVIAQTGRYPTTANTVDQFSVEGESRYWLHVAIDRFTGQVIDHYWEQVNE